MLRRLQRGLAPSDMGLAVARQEDLDRRGQPVEDVASHSDLSGRLVPTAVGLVLEDLQRFGVDAPRLHRIEQGDRRAQVLIGNHEDERVGLPSPRAATTAFG
jgi:hypothetical protein